MCENLPCLFYWVLINPRRHLGVLELHTNGDFADKVLYKSMDNYSFKPTPKNNENLRNNFALSVKLLLFLKSHGCFKITVTEQ